MQPLQVSNLQRSKIGSSFASKRTIQRRAKVLQECRETVSGGGSENVFKQQQKGNPNDGKGKGKFEWLHVQGFRI